MPKGVSIHRMKRGEQVYTFRHESTGETKHFAIDQMLAYIKARNLKPEPVQFHEHMLKHLITRGGAELPHLESLPEEALETPGILCDLGDGSMVLADGVHRALRRALRGDLDFPAFILTKAVWERFLIIDFPDGDIDWADFMVNGDRTGQQAPLLGAIKS